MSNSVMRVWALASCGGLLALTACSNERSGPPQVDSPSPLDDDSAQIDAQAERVASLPRPAVRPETLNPRPLFPSATRSPNPARFPSATTVAGRQSVSSSAEQLRVRVQQIRAQRARVLPASGGPTLSNRSPKPVTTLSPFAVGAQNPLPGGSNSTPTRAGSGTELNRNVLPTSQQVVMALPTLAQPTLAPGAVNSPNSVNPSAINESAANPINASPAATSPVATALTRNNSITSFPHQSFSARSGQALALTPLSSSGIEGNADVDLASDPSVPPRTHQSTARTPETLEDSNTAAAQPLFPIAETPDTEAGTTANDTAVPDTAASEPET
ncbi:MAG: hypothetical protein HC929_07645, partial [Leptolyngbyaceae cyanobacterium SM2_5_2]|nr:hypothetical protein [Leptolyngbyaceae cyanobacterium SM2_5_2]